MFRDVYGIAPVMHNNYIQMRQRRNAHKSPNRNLGIGDLSLSRSSRTLFRDAYGIASLTHLDSVCRRLKSQKSPSWRLGVVREVNIRRYYNISKALRT
ncbi:MAG: hypothetical protein ACK41O_20400, partial [Runella zeae]